MTVIHWFRRDLRLTDNTAFNAAVLASGGAVLPVFVLDDAVLRCAGVAPARVAFLLECLRDLDQSLRARGSRLIVLRGDSARELARLAADSDATALYVNRDYTPLARRRDARVSAALAARGVRVESYKDLVVFEERDVLTGGSSPYTVFTPYKRAWLARQRPHPQPLPPVALRAPNVASLSMPALSDLGFTLTQQIAPGGEAEARRLLDQWIDSRRANAYDTQRNFPGEDGTSRLSPHLRFGTISPHVCIARAEEARNAAPAAERGGFDTWISELIWREFYHQVLANFPHAATGSFKRAYDALSWGNGDAEMDKRYFAAWCEGRTGYPIVDAAMRQLNATAWMHNRARMIVASFLTKDLLLDWRWGERYFMLQLVDGDPASNNGGWQWAASTGTDAQPYFRIFNPRLQSERFDPNGGYIRRWVPELANVRGRLIHAPHELTPLEQRAAGCIIGEQYPAPIVDHFAQKEIILRRFKAIGNS
jgi:deoxyribodipyrimidine photo-lyase